MPYSQILSRAFEITRRHRVLWLFGFLAAFFGGAGGNYNFRGFGPVGPDAPRGEAPSFDPTVLIGVALLVMALLVIFVVVAFVVRYIAESALIHGAARADRGEPVTVRGGLPPAWPRRAFYLFLNQLILLLPVLFLVVALVAVAFVLVAGGVSMAAASESGIFAALGIIAFVLILLPAIALIFLVGIALSLLSQWAAREVVLRGLGPVEAIGAAGRLARANLKETVLFGLLMWAIGTGFGLLLVPVGLIGTALVAAPAYLIYQVGGLVPAILVGAPLIFLAWVVLAVINGLYLTFVSTAWTLAWRHLRGLGPLAGPTRESDGPSEWVIVTPEK